MLDIFSRSVWVPASNTRQRRSGIQEAGSAGACTLAVLLAALLLVSGCAGLRRQLPFLGVSPEEQLAQQVVIERDGRGVPHITGESDAAVLFGLAYAMAEDNYWQIEEDMLRALGRTSHYWGERWLAHDLVRHAFRAEEQAREEYLAAPVEQQQLWAAFTAGLNHYLRDHASVRRLLARYEPWMLLARQHEFDARTLADTIPLGSVAGVLEGLGPWSGPAATDRSWGWAIAPTRTEAGRALLLAALDAPYFGTGQLYQAELRSRSGWHAAGAAVLGTPVLRAGHNTELAWLHTAAPGPAATLHRFIFDHPTDSLAYRDGGGWRRAETWEDTLSVNTSAGVVQRAFRFLRTPHGPVIRRVGDTAWVAVLAAGDAGRFAHWHEVSKATSPGAIRPAAGTRWHTLVAAASGEMASLLPGQVVTSPAEGVLHAGWGTELGRARLAADSSWSVAALERAALEALVPEAAGEIAALVDEWERVGGTNPRRAFALDGAIDALRNWDGRFTPDSRAALLYFTWQLALAEPRHGQGAYRRFTALESARAELVALDSAAARSPASSTAGPGTAARASAVPADSVLPLSWGDVHRVQQRHTSGQETFQDTVPSEPFGAAPWFTGSPYRARSRRDAGWRRYAVEGRAWTAVVELDTAPLARTAQVAGTAGLLAPEQFGELWFGERLTGQVRMRYRPGERAQLLQQ